MTPFSKGGGEVDLQEGGELPALGVKAAFSFFGGKG